MVSVASKGTPISRSTTLGRDQALAAARMLARLKPDRILSSDMSRATRYCPGPWQIWLASLSSPPRPCAKSTAESGKASVTPSWRPILSTVAWSAGVDVPAGGAERRSDVAVRAAKAVRAAADAAADGELVVVVTHGGTIRSPLGLAAGSARGANGASSVGWRTVVGQCSRRTNWAGG